jgi:hypothetical protein
MLDGEEAMEKYIIAGSITRIVTLLQNIYLTH